MFSSINFLEFIISCHWI